MERIAAWCFFTRPNQLKKHKPAISFCLLPIPIQVGSNLVDKRSGYEIKWGRLIFTPLHYGNSSNGFQLQFTYFLPCQQTVRFSQNRIIWYNSYTNSFMKLIKCLTRRFVLSFCHIVESRSCFLLSILLQFSSFLVSIQVIPGETSVTLKKSTLPK